MFAQNWHVHISFSFSFLHIFFYFQAAEHWKQFTADFLPGILAQLWVHQLRLTGSAVASGLLPYVLDGIEFWAVADLTCHDESLLMYTCTEANNMNNMNVAKKLLTNFN